MRARYLGKRMAGGLMLLGTVAPAFAAASFYHGKTVTMVVPYGPGGGYENWVRLIAPYMQRYLGAARVIVINKPGAGGLIGTNYIYASKPDGLTLGDTNAAGDVFSEMAGKRGVHFKISRLTWIGRPDNDPQAISVHANSPYKTFDDLVKLKGTSHVVEALATGKGASTYNAAVITYNAFGIPFKMVAAFTGGHEEKAIFLSGQGTTISLSASSIAQVGNAARVILLVNDKPFDKLPGVPTVVEEAHKHGLPARTVRVLDTMSRILAMGHAFIAPPGVPKARVALLRDAFARCLHNPAFLRKAKRAGLYVGYESGGELARAATSSLKYQSEIRPFLETH